MDTDARRLFEYAEDAAADEHGLHRFVREERLQIIIGAGANRGRQSPALFDIPAADRDNLCARHFARRPRLLDGRGVHARRDAARVGRDGAGTRRRWREVFLPVLGGSRASGGWSG